MNDPVGLRERKKLERRRCIETAAIDLFDTNGFERTTIEQIAARADIAPRTFFSYFPTKEDVVLADSGSRLERVVSEFSKRPETEAPWTALRAAFSVVAADYDTHRNELVRRFQIMATNDTVFARNLQLQAGWEDALTHALAQRAGTDVSTSVGADGLTHRLMAAAALACLRSSLQHWMLTGHTSALPLLLEHCFDQLAMGFE
jgi:AcrR family transcriptional regulator